jgi:hypothetical protein
MGVSVPKAAAVHSDDEQELKKLEAELEAHTTTTHKR